MHCYYFIIQKQLGCHQWYHHYLLSQRTAIGYPVTVSSAALSIRGKEVVPSYFSSHRPYNYICLKYSTAKQLGKAPHAESISCFMEGFPFSSQCKSTLLIYLYLRNPRDSDHTYPANIATGHVKWLNLKNGLLLIFVCASLDLIYTLELKTQPPSFLFSKAH